MTLLRLNSNGVTLNLKNCLFSKDSPQWFFSKEGNKPDRSKLEETEKTRTHQKMQKKLRSFKGFLEVILTGQPTFYDQ